VRVLIQNIIYTTVCDRIWLMKDIKNLKRFIPMGILIGVIVILLGFIGFGYYQYVDLDTQNDSLRSRVAKLEDELGITTENLETTKEEKENLSAELNDKEEYVGQLRNQFEDIAGQVFILDKLSKTDEELLQKYSKIYFLNEHYVPEDLDNIPLTYLYDESKPKEVHAKVLPYLEDVIKDAADDGVTLWIVSAYRSYGTQGALKSGYSITYGSGANAFSADQGYSEHQLGTTIDFTTKNLGGGLNGFGDTEAYQWLQENAYKYGFVLSYSEDNSYYIFEPWHWRFVGVELAKELHKQGIGFYDMSQRGIDEYLISIFD